MFLVIYLLISSLLMPTHLLLQRLWDSQFCTFQGSSCLAFPPRTEQTDRQQTVYKCVTLGYMLECESKELWQRKQHRVALWGIRSLLTSVTVLRSVSATSVVLRRGGVPRADQRLAQQLVLAARKGPSQEQRLSKQEQWEPANIALPEEGLQRCD